MMTSNRIGRGLRMCSKPGWWWKVS